MPDVKRIGAAALVLGVAAMLVAAASAARPTSASNKQAAERDAAQLLRRIVLPAGAHRLSREPQGDGGLLKTSDSRPSGLLVDRHRFWLMPEPFARVSRFVHTRLPRRARLTGTGTSSGPYVPANKSFIFSFPALSGRISSRALEVVLVALPHHRTGIRADAQDVWMVPRPAGEKLPAAVRVIDVQSRKAHIRVTSETKVRRLVRLFDSLPIVQPGGIYGCPPDTIHRPPLSLRFLSTQGALLARAHVPGSFSSGSCAPIEFWIGSHRQKPLSGQVYGRIERVLGVHFV
jgi:hypothetical protein